jgi:hypothetical protein
MMHFIALHENASNNPIGITSKLDRIPLHPYYSLKDLVGFFAFFLVLSIFVFFMPNALGDPLAYMPANPMQTPASIIPEFYFLAFYAILRVIPSKLLGVVAMLSSILILFALPFLDTSRIRSCAFRPLARLVFWAFVVNFFLLAWLGGNHPEPPFVLLGQICTGFYFSYFLILVPAIGILENTLYDIATLPNSKNRRLPMAAAPLKTPPLVESWVIIGLGEVIHPPPQLRGPSNPPPCKKESAASSKEKRLTKKEREAITLSQHQQEALVGLCLGDLHIERRSPTANSRLLYAQSAIHSHYFTFVFEVFQIFCLSLAVGHLFK